MMSIGILVMAGLEICKSPNMSELSRPEGVKRSAAMQSGVHSF